LRSKEYRCPGHSARVDPDPVAGVNEAMYSRLLSVVRTAGTTGATNSNVLAWSCATMSWKIPEVSTSSPVLKKAIRPSGTPERS
jgi:hypothetical protein